MEYNQKQMPLKNQGFSIIMTLSNFAIAGLLSTFRMVLEGKVSEEVTDHGYSF